jgi:ribosomal protein S18 acetylase RimI-like enzyme
VAGNTPDVRIRRAGPDDAPAIASVLQQSFIEYRSAYTDEAFTATTPASDQVRGRIDEGPVWVAECNGAVVGTVSAVPHGEALHVRSMAVSPPARGLGIGESLLREVEDFASAGGYQRLSLSTTPFLTRAIRLYERSGFRPSPESPHDLFGTPLLTMEKSLSRPG